MITDMLALYRRANNAHTLAARAAALLAWNSAQPLPPLVNAQLVGYTRPDPDVPHKLCTIEWLAATLGQQIPKGFVLVGFLTGAELTSAPEIAWAMPERQVLSDLAIDVLRARLSGHVHIRAQVTTRVPQATGRLTLKVLAEPGQDAADVLPKHVINAADDITLTRPDVRLP